MECTKCGLPIEGDRHGGTAIVVSNGMAAGFAGIDRYAGHDIRHPECVDDPAHLPPDQFQKWAVATIHTVMECLSAQVHNHNDLVDALEQLHPGTRTAYEQVLLRGKGNEE